jgi:hypothetical protein
MILTGEYRVWSNGGMILTGQNRVWSIGEMILTGQNRVWSTGGMILTGETQITRRNTLPSITYFNHKSRVDRSGIEKVHPLSETCDWLPLMHEFYLCNTTI